MKLQSLLLPALFAGSALSGGAFAKDKHCLCEEESDDLIQGYLDTFQGIPSGGSLEAVEAVAKKTFATDIKMYSQSLLWVRGYEGPYDEYPPFVDGFEKFKAQYNHTYAPYKVIATSHGCHSISIVWEGNFTSLFGLEPAFGLTQGVDLAFVKPGTKKIGTIYTEPNSLQVALATGGHITSNPNLTECPPTS